MDAQGPDRSEGWGNDGEFAELYPRYLDAVYDQDLIESIASELRARNVERILDCAAGTGFPTLGLIQNMPRSVRFHCTDTSPLMLAELVAQAEELGIRIEDLSPWRRDQVLASADRRSRLILDWGDLSSVSMTYDYVMCRGNSLAYANTWDGSRQVSSTHLIRRYVKKMAARVVPDGYLHVDAPRELEDSEKSYGDVAAATLIWEQITIRSDHRQWELEFTFANNRKLKFELLSTLLTIYDIKVILDDLGFKDTEPLELTGERPGFGVIIARKPH